MTLTVRSSVKHNLEVVVLDVWRTFIADTMLKPSSISKIPTEFSGFRASSSDVKQHASPFKMRAWQIHSYGDLSELQFSSGARKPLIAGSDEVLVEVKATSLNPIDKLMIGK